MNSKTIAIAGGVALGAVLLAGWLRKRGDLMNTTNQASGPRLPSLPALPALPAISGAAPNMPKMPAMPQMPFMGAQAGVPAW